MPDWPQTGGGKRRPSDAWAAGPVPVAREAQPAVATGQERLTGAAEASHQKRLKMMQSEEFAAQEEHHNSWLHKKRIAAALDAEQKRTAALKSLAWLKEQPSEDELATVEYWHCILKQMVAEQEPQAHSPAAENTEVELDAPADLHAPHHPHPNSRQWLRLCLEALKEVGAMYMPLRLLAQSGILLTVMKLNKHPNKSIARYASYVTLQWRMQMMSHSRVLLDPTILSDPVGTLEEKIQNGELVPPTSQMVSPGSKLMPAGLSVSGLSGPGSEKCHAKEEPSLQELAVPSAEEQANSVAGTAGEDGSHSELDTHKPGESGGALSKDCTNVVEGQVEGKEVGCKVEAGGLELDVADFTPEAMAADPQEIPVDGPQEQGPLGITTKAEDTQDGSDVAHGLGTEVVESLHLAAAESIEASTPVDKQEEDSHSKGTLRERKASKEIPGRRRVMERPNHGEDSDCLEHLPDITEEYFPDESVNAADVVGVNGSLMGVGNREEKD